MCGIRYFDLLIINKGIAGLALACGLCEHFNIVIVERNILSEVIKLNHHNITTISLINIAGIKTLQYLKIKDKNTWESFISLYNLEIFNSNNIKQIHLNSGYLGYPALGYITDYYLIYQKFINIIKKSENITFMQCITITNINYQKYKVFVTLSNGDIYEVKLVIGADGINSWARCNANIGLIFKDYKYHGLTAVINNENHHENTLRCMISNDGILMSLPSFKSTYISVIRWLLPSHIVQKNTCHEFNYKTILDHKLTTIRNVLGKCIIYNDVKIKIFPLKMQFAQNIIKNRLILLGQAAYTTYSLFFQDINLELIDSAILLHHLKQLKEDNKDFGNYLHLKYYEQKIRSNMIKTAIYTAYMHYEYNRDNYFANYIHDIIFYIFKNVPYTRQYLIHKIMGLDNIPKWLLSSDHHS